MKKEVIKSNKHIYIIKSIYTAMFVLLTTISIFTFNSIDVHAANEKVLIDHKHDSSCLKKICGFEQGQCIMGGDCSLPMYAGGHFCQFHSHSDSCYGIRCGYQTEFQLEAPDTGLYLIEVWGGSGGGADNKCAASAIGGNGGYAKGTVSVNKGQKLNCIIGVEGKFKSGKQSVANGEKNESYGETGGQTLVKLGSTTLLYAEGGKGGYTYCWHVPNADGGKNGDSGTGVIVSNSLTNTYKSSGSNSGHGKLKITYVHSHSYTSTVTKAATCTAKGVRTYSCSCGHKYTQDIAALGHSPSGWKTDATQHWKVCTRTGCGVITTAKTNHTYGSWVTDTAATCTKAGSKHRNCTVCSYKQTGSISALGHAWPSDWAYANNSNITSGLAYKNCTRCSTRLDSKWLNRIRVRYQKADGTYGSYSNEVNDYYYSGNTISWSRAADGTYKYAGTSWTSTKAAKSQDITVYRNSYTLSLKEGTGISSVSGAGSKLAGASVTIDATVKPGYTWKNWTGTFTATTKKHTFNMPTNDVTLTANATANTYYVDYAKGLTNNAGTTPKTTHTFDQDVTLASNGFTGRTYNLYFDANKPKNGHGQTTSSVLTNLPDTQSGNLTFNKWSVSATYNSGDYAANTNLGKMNFETTNGATAHATALWNNKTLSWGNPSLVGYTFTGWYYDDNTKVNTNNSNNKVIVYPDDKEAYSNTIYAHWSPNTNTPYKVEHWIQKVTDSFKSDSDPKEYELFETENFTGTTDTLVTPAVKQYNGCIAPTVQTVNIAGDGSTVVKYYYTRIKITLDINAEYLGKYYPTNTPSKFDVYVNDIIVATQVRDYYSDQILYGSTWDVRNINPDAGKHYYGVDVN